MDRALTFSARELADEFGVTPRTLQRYVRLGILLAPSRGAFARHPYENWRRLHEIRKGHERCRSRADWVDVFNPTADV